MQEQEKQPQKEKGQDTLLKNKVIATRVILLCVVGIFSPFLLNYLDIHVEWIEDIIGIIAFISFLVLTSFISIKALTKYPVIATLTIVVLMSSFFTWASLVAPNRDAVPVLRAASLAMLITLLWMLYANVSTVILFFEKKFSFIKFSQKTGRIIGFLSVAAVLVLTIIQIFNVFHK